MDRLLAETARAERNHFWFRGFRRFVQPFIAQAAGGSAERLLDCGSGTGTNLQMLGRFGRDFGIDLTWSGLAHAQAAGHRRLARASVAALPFPDDRFDVATSFDVLQCLPDGVERAALTEMHRVLRPGGAAVITVAALDALRGNHSVLAREVRRYTRRRLRAALEGAGFELSRLTYTNLTLFPALFAVRSLQRAAGIAASDDDPRASREITRPPAPINAALSAALALEALAVRVVDMPIGSSLLALARKPR